MRYCEANSCEIFVRRGTAASLAINSSLPEVVLAVRKPDLTGQAQTAAARIIPTATEWFVMIARRLYTQIPISGLRINIMTPSKCSAMRVTLGSGVEMFSVLPAQILRILSTQIPQPICSLN